MLQRLKQSSRPSDPFTWSRTDSSWQHHLGSCDVIAAPTCLRVCPPQPLHVPTLCGIRPVCRRARLSPAPTTTLTPPPTGVQAWPRAAWVLRGRCSTGPTPPSASHPRNAVSLKPDVPKLDYDDTNLKMNVLSSVEIWVRFKCTRPVW